MLTAEKARNVMEARGVMSWLSTDHVRMACAQVDIITFRHKAQRITKQLQEICAILCGLLVATDYRHGQARESKTNPLPS